MSRRPKKSQKDSGIVAQILREIRRHERFLVVSHLRGDGDSIGSEVALAASLRASGKKVVVVKQDVIPAPYAFLRRSWVRENVNAVARLAADCVIFLDVSELPRIGKVLTARLPDRDRARWISIDHHLGHTRFAHLNWVDPAVSSVGEMIFRLVRAGRLPLPPLARDGLYTAIMTDTGRFTYSNTTAEALQIAAELIEAGASPHMLSMQVYRSQTPTELELERHARKNLTLSGPPHAGKVAWITLSRRDFVTAGAGAEHVGELVNITVSIAGVEVGVLFYEPPGMKGVKVSLRGRGGFNVRAVARQFGGGGHRAAAGCNLDMPLAKARKVVLAEILQRLK